MAGIRKRFGATQALDQVDLELKPAEIHALIGENGAGKSSLMKILAGAEIPDEGSMLLEGKAYAPQDPLQAKRLGVSMVYQELSLAPHLSIEENILLGIEPTHFGFIDSSQSRTKVLAALAEVGHADLDPTLKTKTLSLGIQQMVEIARAIVLDAKVLVFDEPTSSLTQEDAELLFALLRRLKKKGMSIVYISHFIEEVMAIADRYTVLRDGKTVGTGHIHDVDEEKIVSMMMGRKLETLYPKSVRNPGKTVLKVKNLSGLQKPQWVSFDLKKGEVLGIFGLVGSGRTELLRALMNLDQVKSAEIKIGAVLAGPSPSKRWNQGLGMVSEDRKAEGLASKLSIADNLMLSKFEGVGPFGFIFPSKQNQLARKWIQKFSIKSKSPTQKISELSGGNQQKVAIARLLHHGVDVLLLDEPTRGIDVGSKAEIYQMMDEWVTQHQKSIIWISSYLPEVMGVSDRIAVMSRGRLLESQSTAQLNPQSILLAATKGKAS